MISLPVFLSNYPASQYDFYYLIALYMLITYDWVEYADNCLIHPKNIVVRMYFSIRSHSAGPAHLGYYDNISLQFWRITCLSSR